MERVGLFGLRLCGPQGLPREEITADVKAAKAFLRRLDLGLGTADALNIAIAQRTRAALGSFDGGERTGLGVSVIAA
jgi:hypothetical protein